LVATNDENQIAVGDENMTEFLKLAAPTGISETILTRAVAGIMRRRPDLQVNMLDGQTPDVIKFLQEGQADLGLAGKDLGKEEGIEASQIPHEDENVLAVAVGDLPALKDILTKEDLANILSTRILIGRGKGSGVHIKCREYLKNQGFGLDGVRDTQFIVQSLEGSVRAVAAGIGVAILPKGTVQEICPQYIKGLRLPGGLGDKRQFYIGWQKGHEFSDVERDLCRVLGVAV